MKNQRPKSYKASAKTGRKARRTVRRANARTR